MHKFKNRKRAFTLIELIVVIAILGILVLITMPKSSLIIPDSVMSIGDSAFYKKSINIINIRKQC